MIKPGLYLNNISGSTVEIEQSLEHKDIKIIHYICIETKELASEHYDEIDDEVLNIYFTYIGEI